MSGLFSCLSFHGDISRWDVSNVTDMSYMFSRSLFNQDISKWNTGNVMRMGSMFEHSAFEGDISGWNVSNVQDLEQLVQGYLLPRRPVLVVDFSWMQDWPCRAKEIWKLSVVLACAIEDQVTRISRLEPHYSEAYAIVESLGMKGLQAGYAMLSDDAGATVLVGHASLRAQWFFIGWAFSPACIEPWHFFDGLHIAFWPGLHDWYFLVSLLPCVDASTFDIIKIAGQIRVLRCLPWFNTTGRISSIWLSHSTSLEYFLATRLIWPTKDLHRRRH